MSFKIPKLIIASGLTVACAFPVLSQTASIDSYNLASLTNKEEKHTMNKEDSINELKSLAHYEIDHSFLLTQAAHNLNDKEIAQKLSSFKEDVEGNIKTLSGMIEKLGGNPPEHSRDFKGFFMQGYAGLRGLTSDYGVLQAVDSNEKIILNTYEKALKQNFEGDANKDLQKIYDKNKEIAEYVKSQAQKLK